jgi:hypothetical protein
MPNCLRRACRPQAEGQDRSSTGAHVVVCLVRAAGPVAARARPVAERRADGAPRLQRVAQGVRAGRALRCSTAVPVPCLFIIRQDRQRICAVARRAPCIACMAAPQVRMMDMPIKSSCLKHAWLLFNSTHIRHRLQEATVKGYGVTRMLCD